MIKFSFILSGKAPPLNLIRLYSLAFLPFKLEADAGHIVFISLPVSLGCKGRVILALLNPLKRQLDSGWLWLTFEISQQQRSRAL
jgi:hypothetical protein